MGNATARHSHSPNYVKYVLAASRVDAWESFVKKVKFDGPNGCWEWQGSITSTGYGMCPRSIDGKAMTLLAHRLALHIARRPVPEDRVVDHLCRNRRCVRPDHLDIVTARENMLRGDGYFAKNARKTHCSRGHEFTSENTLREHSAHANHGRGGVVRVCLACRNGVNPATLHA